MRWHGVSFPVSSHLGHSPSASAPPPAEWKGREGEGREGKGREGKVVWCSVVWCGVVWCCVVWYVTCACRSESSRGVMSARALRAVISAATFARHNKFDSLRFLVSSVTLLSAVSGGEGDGGQQGGQACGEERWWGEGEWRCRAVGGRQAAQGRMSGGMLARGARV